MRLIDQNQELLRQMNRRSALGPSIKHEASMRGPSKETQRQMIQNQINERRSKILEMFNHPESVLRIHEIDRRKRLMNAILWTVALAAIAVQIYVVWF